MLECTVRCYGKSGSRLSTAAWGCTINRRTQKQAVKRQGATLTRWQRLELWNFLIGTEASASRGFEGQLRLWQHSHYRWLTLE